MGLGTSGPGNEGIEKRLDTAGSHLERMHRRHWTVFWGFLIAFITMVFAAIAAWPVIREWLPRQISIRSRISDASEFSTAARATSINTASDNISTDRRSQSI